MFVCVGSINYGAPRSAVITSCSYNRAVPGDSIPGTDPPALRLSEEQSCGVRQSMCCSDPEGSQTREENQLIALDEEMLPPIASCAATWTSCLFLTLLSTRQELLIVSDLRIQNGKLN